MDSSTGGTTKLLLTGSQRPWPKLKVDLQCKSFHWGTPREAKSKRKRGALFPSLIGHFLIFPPNLNSLNSLRHSISWICSYSDVCFLSLFIIQLLHYIVLLVTFSWVTSGHWRQGLLQLFLPAMPIYSRSSVKCQKEQSGTEGKNVDSKPTFHPLVLLLNALCAFIWLNLEVLHSFIELASRGNRKRVWGCKIFLSR